MPWSYKTGYILYLSVRAVHKSLAYLSSVLSVLHIVTSSKPENFPCKYLKCLAIPKICSKDKSILHLLMDIYLLDRYDQYKDRH